MKNPAHLSSSLAELYPPGAVAAELQGVADPALLFPAERERLGRSVLKRVREFTAGRLCARRALAELGIEDFAIKAADDRQPLWPARICGSITHTDGFCAAVVARRDALLSVGIDSETVGQVKADLWPAICRPTEIAWMNTLPAADRAAAVTVIFSAKEAFYKCQYPIVQEALSFHAVSIQPTEWGGDTGSFRICAFHKMKLSAWVEFPTFGRFVFHEDFVTAGIGLPAAGAANQ